jgi:hypothetical protein
MGSRQSVQSRKSSKFDAIPIDSGEKELNAALRIFSFLNESDLQKTRLVSWTWRFISDHNSLWAGLSAKVVPNLSSEFYANDNVK